MEADRIRSLKSIAPYAHLFPKANLKDTRVKRGAVLQDTINFIPIAVKRTYRQTEKYVNQELKGLPLHDACKKLWHFIYEHVQYVKDEAGHEQIRSPARLMHDLKGDCDCFTTTISACLTVLGIRHVLRVAKYTELGGFQHIYPIVPQRDGSYITIDCVLNQFNKEQPFIEVKDTTMDLEFLDGIHGSALAGTDEIVFGAGDVGELGFLKKAIKKVTSNKIVKKVVDAHKKGLQVVKKVSHIVNKANPATVLLRNGLLASLKLNLFNIAGQLKWSYLTDQQAAEKGINMSKFKNLKNIREKMENIFHGAGGEKVNMKKAILSGKGNQNKEVRGIDGLGEVEGLEGMNEYTPLSTLLGPEIFYSENLLGAEDLEGLEDVGLTLEGGLEGLEDGEALTGLGEPATASIAAASAVMATIAALLKNIGSIFNSGKQVVKAVTPDKPTTAAPSAGSGDSATPQQASSVPYQEQDVQQAAMAPVEYAQASNKPINRTVAQSDEGGNSGDAVITSTTPQSDVPITITPPVFAATPPAAKPVYAAEPGFWDKNKKWLVPTMIGVAGVGVVFIGFKLLKPKKAQSGALSGVPKKKKKASQVGRMNLKD